MEIEQCESESSFLDDADTLVSFVNDNDNTLAEYIRVARMYLFGTPIRRMGSACRFITPGCVSFYAVHERRDGARARQACFCC